ncbi:MAG: hypothetical protein ACREPJ_07270, partial [Rhodanobacteraceae bacterium]
PARPGTDARPRIDCPKTPHTCAAFLQARWRRSNASFPRPVARVRPGSFDVIITNHSHLQ